MSAAPAQPVAGSGRASRRTSLGKWVHGLVHASIHPTEFFDFLRGDSSDPDATESQIRALIEAATERDAHTSELSVSARRDLESPFAREVLAVFAMILEHARNGIANSRALWHGHKKSGMAGGIGGRLGGRCADTVANRLDALERAGVLKRWQAPKATSGVVKSKDEHCYQSYFVRHVSRAVMRAVSAAAARMGRQSAYPPESIDRTPPASAPAAPHARAPREAAAPPPQARPPGHSDAYGVTEQWAAFIPF